MNVRKLFGRTPGTVALAGIIMLICTGCPEDARITAANPPVADAGQDITVAARALVRLDGSGSTQTGENLEIEVYRWGMVSRPAIKLGNWATSGVQPRRARKRASM